MGLVRGKHYRILDPRGNPDAEMDTFSMSVELRWTVEDKVFRERMLKHIGKIIECTVRTDCIEAFSWFWHPWMLEEVKVTPTKKLLSHIRGLQ